MGITPEDVPLLLTAGLQTEFMIGQAAYTAHLQPVISTMFKSNKDQETYPWLGESDDMIEWIDERTPKGLKEHGFTIVNKDYESTIGVNRNAILDDQYNQIAPRVQRMGTAAERWKDKRLTEVVIAGTTELCYDGQFFFDTDHDDTNGEFAVQSNAPAAGSGYKVETAAKLIAVAQIVDGMFAQFYLDNGQVAHRKLTHVMVPQVMKWIALAAFDPTFTGGGDTTATQIGKNMCQVIVNEYLPNTGTLGCQPIYWLDLSDPVKPFVFQNRQDAVFVAMDKPDATELFWRKKMFYGVDLRGNFGYGDWRKAIRTEGQ